MPGVTHGNRDLASESLLMLRLSTVRREHDHTLEKDSAVRCVCVTTCGLNLAQDTTGLTSDDIAPPCQISPCVVRTAVPALLKYILHQIALNDVVIATLPKRVMPAIIQTVPQSSVVNTYCL